MAIPNPYFKETRNDGKIRIGFMSDVIVVPNLQLINNGTTFVSSKDNRRLETASKVKVPVLQVEVFPGIESDLADLQFTWNVTVQD